MKYKHRQEIKQRDLTWFDFKPTSTSKSSEKIPLYKNGLLQELLAIITHNPKPNYTPKALSLELLLEVKHHYVKINLSLTNSNKRTKRKLREITFKSAWS